MIKLGIPFDVKNTESSKVRLPLHTMACGNLNRKLISNLIHTRHCKPKAQAGQALFSLLVFLYFASGCIHKGDNAYLITKEKHSFGYKEPWPFLLTLPSTPPTNYFPNILEASKSLIKVEKPLDSPCIMFYLVLHTLPKIKKEKKKTSRHTGCRGGREEAQQDLHVKKKLIQ